jgi:hypothetical protein
MKILKLGQIEKWNALSAEKALEFTGQAYQRQRKIEVEFNTSDYVDVYATTGGKKVFLTREKGLFSVSFAVVSGASITYEGDDGVLVMWRTPFEPKVQNKPTSETFTTVGHRPAISQEQRMLAQLMKRDQEREAAMQQHIAQINARLQATQTEQAAQEITETVIETAEESGGDETAS